MGQTCCTQQNNSKDQSIDREVGETYIYPDPITKQNDNDNSLQNTNSISKNHMKVKSMVENTRTTDTPNHNQKDNTYSPVDLEIHSSQVKIDNNKIVDAHAHAKFESSFENEDDCKQRESSIRQKKSQQQQQQQVDDKLVGSGNATAATISMSANTYKNSTAPTTNNNQNINNGISSQNSASTTMNTLNQIMIINGTTSAAQTKEDIDWDATSSNAKKNKQESHGTVQTVEEDGVATSPAVVATAAATNAVPANSAVSFEMPLPPNLREIHRYSNKVKKQPKEND